MRYLICAIAVAILETSVDAAETIVDVATMKDFRVAPLVRLDDGTEFRLGLSNGGDAAGTWGVLYCLVERPADETRRAASTRSSTTQSRPHGEQLGPVSYEATWDGSLVLADVKSAGRVTIRPYPVLYAGRVLLQHRGRAIVRVYTDDGATLLAEREIEVKAPRQDNWVNFARPRLRDEPAGAECVVMDDPWSAVPELGAGGSRASVSATQPADAALPAEVVDGAHADSRLQLALEQDRFVLRTAGERLMPPVTPDELLARWWVNGKLVPAPPPRRHATEFLKRPQRAANEVALAFGLPDHLGDLKPGDRISLQLLWCPDGHEPLRSDGDIVDMIKTAMRQHTIGWEWPVMTNRIDFALTPQLLAKRDNPIPQPRTPIP